MVTAMRESPIEYEHPSTKVEILENTHSDVNIVAVSSGSTSLIDELFRRITVGLGQTDERYDVFDIADFASACYNDIIRDTIERQLLEPMGLALEDLKRQRKFQEDFIQSLMGDVQDVRNTINQHLDVLLAGTDPTGASIFEVQAGDVVSHNSIGYATVGSGSNPAAAEFMRSQYSVENEIDKTISTVVSAKKRAEDAQGVGESMDLAVATQDNVEQAGPETIESLLMREATIRNRQEEVKNSVLSENSIEWVSSL